MSYQEKYLKYKKKYIELKKNLSMQRGGAVVVDYQALMNALKKKDVKAVGVLINGADEIDLDNKQLGDDLVMVLAEALKGNNTVETVYLQKNNLTNNSAQALMDLLSKNSKILHIDLGHNDNISGPSPIGAKLGIALHNRRFPDQPPIVYPEVDPMKNYELTDALKKKDLEAVRALIKSTDEIDLDHKQLGDDAVMVLIEALKNNNIVEKVYLENNNLTDKSAQALMDLLSKNSKILYIDIQYNDAISGSNHAMLQNTLNNRRRFPGTHHNY